MSWAYNFVCFSGDTASKHCVKLNNRACKAILAVKFANTVRSSMLLGSGIVHGAGTWQTCVFLLNLKGASINKRHTSTFLHSLRGASNNCTRHTSDLMLGTLLTHAGDVPAGMNFLFGHSSWFWVRARGVCGSSHARKLSQCYLVEYVKLECTQGHHRMQASKLGICMSNQQTTSPL